MLETTNILEKIYGVNHESLPIQFKNSRTGEVLGFEYCYIADEILFLFASPEGQAMVRNYLSFLDSESYDDCWDTYVDNYDDSLGQEEMIEAKYNVVTGLETRVYIGDLNECPIRYFDDSYEMKSVEATEDALILTF